VSPAEVDSLERLLAERLPVFRLSRRILPVNPNYWVHIPSLRTRRDAENKVGELRRLGVREYFITQESDGFAVSLGLFSTQGAAESQLATLREQGVRSARVSERPRRQSPPRIELLGPEPQAGELRQLLAQALPQARMGACGRSAAQ
jgi:cell division septation protein DedD